MIIIFDPGGEKERKASSECLKGIYGDTALERNT